MTLIKSKINSLAWLKSAIYVSVVGGVILSSTPVLSAYFVFPPRGDEDSISFVVKEDTFLIGRSPLRPLPGVSPWWDIFININRTNGSILGRDTLEIDVNLKHIAAPHRGDNGSGSPLTFKLFVDSAKPQFDILSGFDTASHAGINHRDSVRGSLTRTISSNSVNSDIKNWTLEVNASHHVPEPTTMLGAAVALGWGGWLKRKNSIKQDKTKIQG
jgi:hypothetical protein